MSIILLKKVMNSLRLRNYLNLMNCKIESLLIFFFSFVSKSKNK